VHLGTNHTELYVTPQQAMDVIPKLPFLYDEPFSDSSQIPTYLVSQMARDQVTVVLSGDGGDEFFCGYDRYLDTVPLWNKINKVPNNFKKLTATLLKLFKPLGVGKLQTLIALLEKCRSVDDVYRHLMTDANVFKMLNNIKNLPPVNLTDPIFGEEISDPYNRLMLYDQMAYLVDDILVKVDRASMGVSLESRVPLLDYRVAEFAWSLPMSMKIHNGKEKYILRNLLSRYVPTEMFDRPKMGFAVPVGEWIKTPLLDWAENLLDKNKMQQQGFLNVDYVHRLWEQHKSNQFDHNFFMWKVLMFQAWLENN
ncbi:Asparagine synthetase [glutamine-hydrolyzing], partial [hydrothermal vent metagenome]